MGHLFHRGDDRLLELRLAVGAVIDQVEPVRDFARFERLAITRGQRQTGGQGLFRPEDNLESPYARDALRQLYRRIYRSDVVGCSRAAFEDATVDVQGDTALAIQVH